MSLVELANRISMSRERMGANQAFLLEEESRFYIVEEGFVDLFTVVTDDARTSMTRKPFIGRVAAGNAFFGAFPWPMATGEGENGQGSFYAVQVVPSRDAVILSGDRNQLASKGDFDLDAVILIDDWVKTASNFISNYESTPSARDIQLLEADPDVPYKKHAILGVHHLDVIWVKSNRPARFVGRESPGVAAEEFLPLTEQTWLNLREDSKVSAVHTPGAIVGGWIWEAMDRFNSRVLECGGQYWKESCEQSLAQYGEHRKWNRFAESAMTRNLANLLGDLPAVSRETAAGADDMMFAAAAIVAETAGVKLEYSVAASNGADPLRAVEELVKPAGIRSRRVALAPGWERREGSSFVGILPDDGGSRPVAVINKGRNDWRMHDPASGSAERINRRLAESIGKTGLIFYAPLPAKVKSGLAALLHALRGRRRDMLGVALMGCLGAVIALLIPIMTGNLLATIIPRVDIPMWVAALAALSLGAFASAAFGIVGALCMLRLEARVDETLQAAVWNRLLSLPLPFFRNYLAGDLADRANGVSLVRQILTGATSSSILSGVFSIFSYGLLFYYSWELALWSGLTVLVLAAATWFFAKRQIGHTRTALMAQGVIDGLVFQIIRGVSKLRQASAEAHVLKKWSEKYINQKQAHLSARKWAAGQLTFNALFGPAVQLVLLGLIWYLLIEGDDQAQFALGDFLSFHAAFGQFVGGVTGFTAAWVTVITVLPLFERIQPILEAEPEKPEGSVVLPRPAGRVDFMNVNFRYPAATADVLSNVSFEIEAGEYVAFVGPSGSGKSTVYRLLLGFERPATGTVLVDGHDLTTLDLSSMRSHMGVVLQNGQLIPDTIYNNIAGELDLDVEEVWDALRSVGLEEDIRALPMGIRSLLSESGSGLSGGQRQRLLVARALARKPAILLFDEATSMLDNRSQDIVRKTLRGLTGTRVVIAHRLSTVIDADRIIVMQKGRIVESGKYKDLMERDGVMADMARRQLI